METQRSNNSTNSIQFANLITGKHTLKPDNVIKSKPFLFFSSPSHFISLQPLPRDSPITSASFSYLSFLLVIHFIYFPAFYSPFVMHHTSTLRCPYIASFTSLFTRYIFRASIFPKSRYAAKTTGYPSFPFLLAKRRPITQLLAVAFQLIPTPAV